jgi:hypothetical protein
MSKSEPMDGVKVLTRQLIVAEDENHSWKFEPQIT